MPINKNIFIRDILQELEEENVAVFAGAGLSMPVGYVGWEELLKPIAEELNIDIKKEYDLVSLAQYYLNELFPLWHVRLIGICDGVDTNDMKNLRLRQINGLINEWYSEDLSDNIRQILRDKMMRGQFIGSFACYGYTKDPAHLHSLIPDPPAAAVVREIYQLYIDGFSLSKIASLLTKKQVMPPCFYKIQHGILFQTPFSKNKITDEADGKIPKWSASSVRHILTNPVYTGTLIQGTTKKESAKSKKRIKLSNTEWIIYPNAHPALISEDIFCEVSSLLQKRRKKNKKV